MYVDMSSMYSVDITAQDRHNYYEWYVFKMGNDHIDNCCWSVYNVMAVNFTSNVTKPIPVCPTQYSNSQCGEQITVRTLFFEFKNNGSIEIAEPLPCPSSLFSTSSSIPSSSLTTSSSLSSTPSPSLTTSSSLSSTPSLSLTTSSSLSSTPSPSLTTKKTISESPTPTNINIMCTGIDIWPDTLVGHNATGTCSKGTVNGTFPLIYVTYSTIY